MLRRIILVDVVLLVLVVTGAIKFRQKWLEFEDTHHVESIQAAAETARIMPATTATTAPVGDWTEIVTKNPFSFDRNDIAILAPPPPPAPAAAEPPKGPKPLLFGTFSIGKDWQAMMGSGQPGANRKTRVVKVGEEIDGWKLAEIQDKSVVITSGAARETISIDTATPRDSSRTAATSIQPQTAAVQTTQSTAAAPSAPAATNTQAPPTTGTTGKGHWLDSPFGRIWIND